MLAGVSDQTPAPDAAASLVSLPPTACCGNCEYSLRGLTEQRCPECGTAFDPLDPDTYWNKNRSRIALRLWRHWAKPPSRWRCALVVVLTVLTWSYVEDWPPTPITIYRNWWLAAWLALGLSQVVTRDALKRCGWRRLGKAPEEQRRERWRWRVLPICAGLSIAGLALAQVAPGVMIAPRLHLSRPFLESKARSILATGNAEPAACWVGLFHCYRIVPVGDGRVRFDFFPSYFDTRSDWLVYDPVAEGTDRHQRIPFARQWYLW